MSYELHVVRTEEHYDREENPISLDEWITYAANSQILTESGWVEWEDTGRVPVFSYRCTDGTEASLTWSEGGVDIKGILNEQETLEFVALATDLDANLVSDDGERYMVDGVVRAE